MEAAYLAPYAAILTLIYVGLAILVIRQRYRTETALGDGGHADLTRAIRAHANFAEYTPLALILLYLLFRLALPYPLVAGLAIWFILGRILHAYSVLVAEHRDMFRFRMAGMISTFSVLLIAALLLLFHQISLSFA